VDKNLFIFSFKKRPSGIFWMVIIFLLLEASTRILWKPNIIYELEPIPLEYRRLEPSYNYGYTQRPLFYEKDNKLVLYPTEYLWTYLQRMNKIKEDNEFRIFVIGSSVAVGPKRDNYSHFLKKFLPAINHEREWQVINISFQGFGTSRLLIALKKTLKYEPDLLILHPGGTNEYEDEKDLLNKRTTHFGFNTIIYRSNFIVILKKIFTKYAPDTVLSINIESEHEAYQKEENLRRWRVSLDNNLSEMVKIAKKSNVPVILVGAACEYLAKGYAGNILTPLNNTVKKYASLNRVYYIDSAEIMYKHFPNKEDKEKLCSGWHWSRYAHRLIAKEITDIIIRTVKKNQL